MYFFPTDDKHRVVRSQYAAGAQQSLRLSICHTYIISDIGLTHTRPPNISHELGETSRNPPRPLTPTPHSLPKEGRKKRTARRTGSHASFTPTIAFKHYAIITALPLPLFPSDRRQSDWMHRAAYGAQSISTVFSKQLPTAPLLYDPASSTVW